MDPSEMNDGRLTEMMGGFGMGFGAIFWIVLLALVIWAVTSAGARTGHRSEASAKAILDERLARGEISVDEYRKLRAAL